MREQFHEGTADFLTGLMEQHEEMAWMLRSFIEGESLRSDGAQSTESRFRSGEVVDSKQQKAEGRSFCLFTLQRRPGKADLTTREWCGLADSGRGKLFALNLHQRVKIRSGLPSDILPQR